ncbi:MAG: ACP S-malonyltransferase, partial [Bacillota bacterium]
MQFDWEWCAIKKIAFLFPGQGSQQVGMGRALASEYPEIEETLDKAGELIGIDLKQLCFFGPDAELTRTSNAQPALLAVSVATMKIVAKHITPAVVLGHSLGEYSALVACGAMRFEDAVLLVRKRGELMESAADGSGAMCAVIGLDLAQVERVCRSVSEYGTVVPANINCPGQIVISGHREAVRLAAEEASRIGARRTVMLNVSGAFHSPLMETPARLFAPHLDAVPIRDAQVPIVSNVTGTAVWSGSEIKELLLRQLTSPVRFEDCVRALVQLGVDGCVELGPQKVVSGLVRRTAKGMP